MLSPFSRADSLRSAERWRLTQTQLDCPPIQRNPIRKSCGHVDGLTLYGLPHQRAAGAAADVMRLAAAMPAEMKAKQLDYQPTRRKAERILQRLLRQSMRSVMMQKPTDDCGLSCTCAQAARRWQWSKATPPSSEFCPNGLHSTVSCTISGRPCQSFSQAWLDIRDNCQGLDSVKYRPG